MKKVENKSVVENWNSDSFDKKHKINCSDKEVSTELLADINNGVSIEKLDSLKNEYNLPIFKYQTQITIHGVFSELRYNYINGYKNIFQNKNKSIGVKWNAIDVEKRKRIAKRLKHKNIRYSENSSNHYFSRMDYVTEENAESLLNEYTENLRCFQKSKFYGGARIYTGNIIGVKVIVLEATINAIYEKDIHNLFENFGVGDREYAELERVEKEKRENRDIEWKNKWETEAREKEAKKKVLIEQVKKELAENKQEENPERGVIENGLCYSVKFNVYTDVDEEKYSTFNTGYVYILKNVYTPKGKKKARVWTKEFDTFKAMLDYKNNNNEFESYSDRIVKSNVKGIKFTEENKEVEVVENRVEYRENNVRKNNGVEVIYNKEKEGIEVRFEEFPAVAVRDRMKTNKWRWSRYNRCWYNRDNEVNRKFVESI